MYGKFYHPRTLQRMYPECPMCRASIHRRDLPGGTRSDEERINIGEPAYTLRTDEGRLRELRRRQIIEREER